MKLVTPHIAAKYSVGLEYFGILNERVCCFEELPVGVGVGVGVTERLFYLFIFCTAVSARYTLCVICYMSQKRWKSARVGGGWMTAGFYIY